MGDELEDKWRVAADLIQKGASEVIISDEQFVVRVSAEVVPPSDTPASAQTININVAAQASALSLTAVRSELHSIREELVQRRSRDADEIREHLDQLEAELSRAKPRKGRLKKFLKWAADLDWATFAKLAKIIIRTVEGAG